MSPSKRAEIRMSEEELARFVAEERIVTCATLGPEGRPHLMPLWYVVQDGLVTAWTFAKSQKVRNLERRPQATLLIEAGEQYHELRGAMFDCDVDIVRDRDTVTTVGTALAIKYLRVPGATPDSPEVREHVARQAPKRVALRFRPTRIVSWDHRKLSSGA